jgi:hypothetical protein
MNRSVVRSVVVKIVAACLSLFLAAGPAHASTHRQFTLILDFSTCVTDPNDPTILTCVEKDGTGKPVGQIKVTFQTFIATDGTCDSNAGCAMSWHEGYLYTLDGGTMTVATATAWQEQAAETDETGAAPILGFSVGAVTNSTGRYTGAKGTLTMRWDGNICICLFDIVQPA